MVWFGTCGGRWFGVLIVLYSFVVGLGLVFVCVFWVFWCRIRGLVVLGLYFFGCGFFWCFFEMLLLRCVLGCLAI